MNIRLTVLLLILTAFSAAAQAPVRSVSHYPAVQPAAEIHFVDGNVSHFPVMRISKELMRVDAGNSQSHRMPLTYVESVKFNDGCTLYFDKGVFQFDKLVQPARLKNESGDALLEGVLVLNGGQTEALMGAETFRKYQKNSRLTKIGAGAIAAGTMMTIPYVSTVVLNTFKTKKIDEIGGSFAIAGGGLLIAGLTMYFIGNNQCNRVVATYNDGLGVAYTF